MNNLPRLLDYMLRIALLAEGALLLGVLLAHALFERGAEAFSLLLGYHLLVLPLLIIGRGTVGLLRYDDVQPLWPALAAVVVVALAHGVSYLAWGLLTGLLLTPDPGTVMLTRLFLGVSLGVMTVVGLTWVFAFWRPRAAA